MGHPDYAGNEKQCGQRLRDAHLLGRAFATLFVGEPDTRQIAHAAFLEAFTEGVSSALAEILHRR